jgi:TolA-binding protein
MASIGEAHLSYGDYARAAEVLKSALSKGISEPGAADLARLHLGIALYRQGQPTEAQNAWAEIKSANGAAVLAQSWSLISRVR